MEIDNGKESRPLTEGEIQTANQMMTNLIINYRNPSINQSEDSLCYHSTGPGKKKSDIIKYWWKYIQFLYMCIYACMHIYVYTICVLIRKQIYTVGAENSLVLTVKKDAHMQ